MKWNMLDATRFAGAQGLPDLSSLHWGISSLWATVHIDEVGFVMAGPGGEIVVNPDFLHHFVAELLWKTKLKGKLPLWMTENINLIVPSASNLYLRWGAELDLLKSKRSRLTLSGTCTTYGKFECTVSVTLSGSF